MRKSSQTVGSLPGALLIVQICAGAPNLAASGRRQPAGCAVGLQPAISIDFRRVSAVRQPPAGGLGGRDSPTEAGLWGAGAPQNEAGGLGGGSPPGGEGVFFVVFNVFRPQRPGNYALAPTLRMSRLRRGVLGDSVFTSPRGVPAEPGGRRSAVTLRAPHPHST